MLLPLIGEGRDGGCPARVLLSMRHSEQRSRAERDSESPATPANASLRLEAMRERKRTKPVKWWETMSFPTTRIIQIRAGVPSNLNQCVTPASEPESPVSIGMLKFILSFAICPTLRL